MASSVAYALCVILCICSLQTLVMAKKEKIGLVVYSHEIRGGPNATLLLAAGTGEGNISAAGWGSFLVFDSMMKEGPSPSSTLLGQVTGSGALTTTGGENAGGVQVVIKFWFSPESKYEGSSLTVAGTVSLPLSPWELTVIAGTGHFRGYTGYALAAPELAYTVPPLYVYHWKFHLFKMW